MRLSLLIIFLLCISCSRKTDREFVVLNQSWKQISETKHSKRSRDVASLVEPECRDDFFQKEFLISEIKLLENKLENNKKMLGAWKHLQYRDLPVGQVNFLQKYGKQLGDLNKTDYDFSICSDVPCIINTIYQSPEGIEGFVIYYWYLKMGTLLAVDNNVYDQASTIAGIYLNKSYLFKDYLFDKNELYGFWKLAQTLPPRYFLLTNLDEIQRIPKGSHIEDQSANTCGLAYNTGHILLNDGCLDIGTGESKGEGYFYEAVPHELSHQIDFLTAISIKPYSSYYSTTDEWKKEAGWFIRETIDASTGAIKIRQWESTLASEKFISNYAQTSPAEHFAETLAFTYHRADNTKKIVPETTYQLVQKKFFDQHEYDYNNLKEDFLKISDNFELQIFNLTEECLKNPKVYKLLDGAENFEKYFKNIKAPEVRSCLAYHLKTTLELTINEINRTKFYGCQYSKGSESKVLKNDVQIVLSNKMNHHYTAYLTDKNYFNLFAQFYKQFETVREGQIAYMTCQGENDEEICYKNSVRKQIVELLPPELEFKETAIADLLNQYLTKFPLTTSRDETLKIYQQFVLSSQIAIKENAISFWDSCKKVPPTEEEPPLGIPFSAKENFVVSSLMNCLNHSIVSEVENLVQQLNSDVLIKNEKETRLIKNLILPLYVKYLDEKLLFSIEEEKKEIESYNNSESISLKQIMMGDFSWMKSFADKGKQLSECQNNVLGMIKIPLYFHHSKLIFGNLITGICEDIINSAEFKKYLETVYLSSWGAAEDSLRTNLTARASAMSQDCLTSYPKSTGLLETMNSKKRLSCFDEQWSYIEMSVIREFNGSGLGAKYQFDQVELKHRYKIIAPQVKSEIKKLYLQ